MKRRLIVVIIFAGIFECVRAQKGEMSISAGALVSFPQNSNEFQAKLKTGAGLEATGQYNFSNNSAILLQVNWASYGIKNTNTLDTGVKERPTIYSFKGGYKYQFGSSGFYANALGGIEKYSGNNLSYTSFAVGVGKRFIIKGPCFIDAGIDYISGITDMRLNIKAIVCLWRRPKK